MKSPFPGMDPYIEEIGVWENFHFSLISKIQDALGDRVPDRYTVRAGERAYVVLAEKDGKETHAFLPDVGVTAPAWPSDATDAQTAAVAVASDADAISMRAFVATEYRENFVEIYVNEPERLLVTCIEVLSPSNKRRNSPGWDLYLRKRQALLLGEAKLVEIDLLRGGTRFPMFDPWPSSPYTLLVSRRQRSPYCTVQPAHFQRPLPTIPVPLLSPDPDVSLDLQPMVEAIYARSRYGRDIDYARPLSRPLTEDESAWLAARLQQHATT